MKEDDLIEMIERIVRKRKVDERDVDKIIGRIISNAVKGVWEWIRS